MFEVFWLPEAFDRLELILSQAPDPDAIVEAVLEIDRLLSSDPKGHSESRPNNTRIAFARPIGVLFEINEAARTVQIGAVWRMQSK